MESMNGFLWSNHLPYGISDLKKNAACRYAIGMSDALIQSEHIQCCVEGCEGWLAKRKGGQKQAAENFCQQHGISMSKKPTYIFRDPKRNFIIGQEGLAHMKKVEKWRLGYETSEDALTWNVFVSLYALNTLKDAFVKFTGISPMAEPELYLWGNRIGATGPQWLNLVTIRNVLEEKLAIQTEPDIILRVPGQAIVLIEAKFGSPNGTFAGKEKGKRFGSVVDFLSRYRCKENAPDPLNRKWISKQTGNLVLEQLCRNVIFAHWLASEVE
ncbi:MAG: hypothetical protein JWQ04_2982 [Pedosphaera sp.]|nr:hypothetical protein [Pedosphaera sp.]